MKTELLYIIKGIKKLGIGLLDKRYYIFAFWVVGWIIPTTLVVLYTSIPKSKMLTVAQAYSIRPEQVLPIWSWELNWQWVELEAFMPLGLAVSGFLIVILLGQIMREAKKAEREWHRT